MQAAGLFENRRSMFQRVGVEREPGSIDFVDEGDRRRKCVVGEELPDGLVVRFPEICVVDLQFILNDVNLLL